MAQSSDLVILTEGDRARGLGHLGRCLGYAQHWRGLGRRVLWVVDGDDAARRVLDGETVVWRRWQDGADVPEAEGRVAVADSYSTGRAALEAVSRRAAAAVFLDDLERDAYPPGLVVHSAPGALDRGGRAARWLVGPAWQPMPSAFWRVKDRGPARPAVQSLLVLTGGADLRNLGGRLARLARSVFPGAHVCLIRGAGARHDIGDIRGVTVRRDLSPRALRDLMLEADLACSAAGQTLYQLARCGVPTLTVGVADNQAKHLREWPRTGAMLSAGPWNAPDLDLRVLKGLETLRDRSVRAAMSAAGQASVDGQGVACLAERIEAMLG